MSTKKKLIIFGGGAIFVVLAAIVLIIFQPQRLFIDDVVNEDRPQAFVPATPSTPTTSAPVDIPDPLGDPSASSPSSSSTTTAAPALAANLKGEFVALGNYTTSGLAEVIPVSDSERILRLEEFSTTNGPDLFVYLTTQPNPNAPFSSDDDHVDLGRLKGNVGGQNYEIPADADLSRYTTVLIYCKRFSTSFGAATLQ